MDTYAADAAAVADHLDLRDAVHVGHAREAEKSPGTSPATAPVEWQRQC